MPSILQFRIELLEIAPPIWRRIQVPADSSFWDLHVAIQDAMGWTDSPCTPSSWTIRRRAAARSGFPTTKPWSR